MPVPNIFASATSAIPLSQLDQNFATAITLGNTAVYLGNTTTSLGNVTLTNVTISSGNVSVSTATVGAGSNTAPSITTTGDTNTGIFFPAADTIAFTEGGVESMRIDSAGNMGFGVTPSATWSSSARAIQLGGFNSIFGYTSNVFRLANNAIFTAANETYGASSIGATYYQQYNGIHSWYNAASGTAGNTISFTQAMTLDASGNLGIGTSSPTQKLQVAGKIAVSGTNPSIQQTVQNASLDLCGGTTVGTDPSIQIAGSTTTSDANKIFYNSNAHLFRSTSGGSTYATIDTSGNLLVGNTDNSNLASAQGLYLRGTGTDNCLYGLNSATTSDGVSLALFYSSFSTANQTKFEVKADGDVFSRTNSYGGFSDVRLKQGITLANSQWSDIKNIEVVKFQMKSEQFSDAENPWMLGVIAQQVEQVSPGLVDEDVKDGIKTVKYSILYMKAVKALQEAMTRIEQLEADVAALKGTA